MKLAPVVALGLALLLPARAGAAGLADHVNTLRGTSHVDGSGQVVDERAYSRGNTVPAAARPFGFNMWTPVTNVAYSGWPYTYSDTAILGFACSHQPSAWGGDLAHFQVMPEVGAAAVTDQAARAQPFSHQHETARAHYYSVTFDNGLKTEITPTDHASAWRFTYPTGQPSAYLVWDTGSTDIRVDTTQRTVSGSVDRTNRSQCLHAPCNKLYFFATYSKAGATAAYPPAGGATLAFAAKAGEVVTMNLATSFISVEQARSNLGQEVGKKSFARLEREAAAEWNKWLSRVTLTGATDDQLTIFYSSLYRAFLYPSSRWENVEGVGPQYFSPYSSTVMNGKMYVNNGLWDTYRATRPLTVLLAPARTAEILDGFVNAYKEGGWAPRWSGAGYRASMLGTHSDIVFADAYMKGVRGFDVATAYQSMLRNATVISNDPFVGRQCLERSLFLQYCPAEAEPYSASWYLEDTVNDYGLALLAEALGRPAEHAYFMNRALTYVNHFSAGARDTLPDGRVSPGFFRGRHLDGSWRQSDAAFAAREWGHEWTEGNAWHYVAAAAHDPLGLGSLYGRIPGSVADARAALARKIDDVFAADRRFLVGDYDEVIHEMQEGFDLDRGQYVHSNQPVHLMLHLYNYAGMPWKTQEHVRDLLAHFFDSGRKAGQGGWGYRGDEDGGEQSSWYVFAVLGLFPASPGHREYAIGSPPYAAAKIRLQNGKTFTVRTVHGGAANVYVQSARLDGAPYPKNYLTHEQILAGGTLELSMGAQPSTWGSAPGDTPPSISTSSTRIPVPMEHMERGGTVSGGGDAGKLFDADGQTRWLAPTATPAVTYAFPHGHRHAVALYTLTSAADLPARDPRSWTLLGSNDGQSWTLLDQRDGESFTWRGQTRVFALSDSTPYAQLHLVVRENGGDAAATQLAELDFITAAPLAAAAASSDGASCGAQEDASNAIDGTSATGWCSAAASPWLSVDLGASVALQQLRLRHAAGALATRDFDLLVSEDGNTWTTVATVRGNHDDVTQHTFPATPARFVKLVVGAPQQGAGGQARILELEAFGRRTR